MSLRLFAFLGLVCLGSAIGDVKRKTEFISFYEDNPTYSDAAETHWPTDNASNHGISEKKLEDATAELAKLPQSLSFLVLKNGKLIHERYFHGSQITDSNNVHSSSKTILSALVGISLREGFIKSLDQTLPELLPGYSIKGRRRDIRLRHLMSMTAGLKWTEDETEYEIEDENDWVQAILNLPLVSEPGEKFKYSSGLTHLISAILTKNSGMSLRALAEKFLFGPLNITAEHWGRDPQGYYSGGYNLYLKPRELARIGQLYLQKGNWQGKSLLPADWIEDATRPKFQVDRTRAYGLLWWLPTQLGQAVHKMWGYGGQFVYVLPEKNLVVVLTADTKEDHPEMNGDEFLTRFILPTL